MQPSTYPVICRSVPPVPQAAGSARQRTGYRASELRTRPSFSGYRHRTTRATASSGVLCNRQRSNVLGSRRERRRWWLGVLVGRQAWRRRGRRCAVGRGCVPRLDSCRSSGVLVAAQPPFSDGGGLCWKLCGEGGQGSPRSAMAASD